jgi:hypothetical protein
MSISETFRNIRNVDKAAPWNIRVKKDDAIEKKLARSHNRNIYRPPVNIGGCEKEK